MNIKIGILNVPRHDNKHNLIHFVTHIPFIGVVINFICLKKCVCAKTWRRNISYLTVNVAKTKVNVDDQNGHHHSPVWSIWKVREFRTIFLRNGIIKMIKLIVNLIMSGFSGKSKRILTFCSPPFWKLPYHHNSKMLKLRFSRKWLFLPYSCKAEKHIERRGPKCWNYTYNVLLKSSKSSKAAFISTT